MSNPNQTKKGSAAPEAVRIGIGSRVKCNKGFAAAFEGQTGTITDSRVDSFGKTLWTVAFDTPTPPATNWEPCKTLAAEADCYELLPEGGMAVDEIPGYLDAVYGAKWKAIVAAAEQGKQITVIDASGEAAS